MEIISLEEFLKIDFLEGDLVEYKDGYRFSLEYNRGKIESFDISDNFLLIKSDNEKAHLKIDLEYMRVILKNDSIYFLDIPILYCYALSQKGVNIPRKINYEEVVNFKSN